MASREYSARLGVISDEQLQAALDRFGLGRFVSAEPIANGLFGQNLMVTASTGDYIFRGAPHWNPAGEDDWQFQKERFFSRVVHDSPSGPPVVWPYLLEEGRDIFGWGFAFQPRLPGGPLQQPLGKHYSPSEILEQSRQLGKALGALHSVEMPEPGTHDPQTDSIQPLGKSYADYVEWVVEELLDRSASASSATSADDIAWARTILARSREFLEMPFQPVVVHLDYGFHNVLFEKSDGAWNLTGVIDWMTAEAGHPECDLARPLATDMQFRLAAGDALMEGYRSIQPEMPGFRERFPVFMLWERLLIWAYWQTHNGFKEGLGMRKWMEPFVRMLD
ncbi:MAG: phosphotransferase family protein [Dehalococcoidia bacterium]